MPLSISPLKKISGFTLIELMIVLTIVAVIMTMGLPQMASYLRNNRLTTQTNHFIAILNFARAQAISRNQEIFVTSVDSNTLYYWEKGWQVWLDGYAGCADPKSNGIQEECEILRDFKTENVKLKGPEDLNSISYAKVTDSAVKSRTFSFNGGNGSLNITTAMHFYMCHSDGDYEGRSILLRPTGRSRVDDGHLSPCPAATN